jgi:hypothetical protein
MVGVHRRAASGSAWRGRVAVILAIAVLGGLWAASHAPNANAENFCTGVTLSPYQQGGDRCTAPNGGYIWGVVLVTHTRAGCASIANNGVVLETWTCTSAGNTLQTYYSPNNRWAHGIIRNNNLSSSGVFDGNQQY